jgi:hypothetical protein
MIALTLVAGCVPSLNPVYTDEQLVFMEDVLGTWQQSESPNRWEFTKRDDKSYWLLYTEEDGRQGRFVAHVADLNGTMFLDLFPAEIETDATGFYNFHLVPIHTIYRVRSTGSNLELSVVDYRWFDKQLSEHPEAIQFATFNGRKLITAPTEDVQAFVVEHKDKFTANIKLEKVNSAAAKQ